jgi:hypothetical protein
LPLRVLEIGSSAGLNLRWDRYRYDGGADGTGFGPVNSPVRLTGGYHAPAPRLDVLAMVAERRGCDASPLDATAREDQLTLKSFVWPEQADRLARLDAALQVAERVPAPVDRADAGEWVEAQLADDSAAAGTATVVFHSIVVAVPGGPHPGPAAHPVSPGGPGRVGCGTAGLAADGTGRRQRRFGGHRDLAHDVAGRPGAEGRPGRLPRPMGRGPPRLA